MRIDDFKGLFAKFLGYWMLSGLIIMSLSLTCVALTGGFEDIIGELAINAVLERLPFPFDLIVTSQIDPLSTILQLIIFIVLVAIIEGRSA